MLELFCPLAVSITLGRMQCDRYRIFPFIRYYKMSNYDYYGENHNICSKQSTKKTVLEQIFFIAKVAL